MASTLPLSGRPQATDWLKPQLRWIMWPSWLLSAMAHAGIWSAFLVASQLKSCQPDIAGDGGADFREVGIRLRDSLADRAEEPPAASDALPSSDLSASFDSLVAPNAVEDLPPVDLMLPAPKRPSVIGIGSAPLTGSDALASSLLTPAQGVAGSPSRGVPGEAGGGPGATSFMGITDAARRFVYVVDRSYSMEDYGAFRAAKSELAASLERLDGEQEFQVIFYNHEQPIVLKPATGRFEVFYGTPTQRADARREINKVSPYGGTQHKPALLAALKLNPDVIFFLTDGQSDVLLAGDLEEIKRKNRGAARIHCVEFGKGSRITDAGGNDPGNFLVKLADQNSGKYIYRDVTQFDRR